MGYKKRTNKITDEIIEVSEEIVPETVPESVPESFGTARLARAENTEDADAITPNNTEMDEASRRKQEIADKRRASLALARSKIVPKSALKKQAAEVIKSKDELLRNKQEETDAMKLKYERDRIKTLEDNLMALQKLIADKPTPTQPVAVPVPVPEPLPPLPLPKQRKQRPSRSKEALAMREVRELPVGIPEKQPRESAQPKLITPKKSVEPRMIAPHSTERLIDKSYGEQLQERLRSQALHKIMNETFGGF
jgi:hypothetical protein